MGGGRVLTKNYLNKRKEIIKIRYTLSNQNDNTAAQNNLMNKFNVYRLNETYRNRN